MNPPSISTSRMWFVVILENESVSGLIQVCYDMSLMDTRERELRALKKGMKHFGLDKGVILTMDQEEMIVENDFEITVIPAAKWLLGSGV